MKKYVFLLAAMMIFASLLIGCQDVQKEGNDGQNLFAGNGAYYDIVEKGDYYTIETYYYYYLYTLYDMHGNPTIKQTSKYQPEISMVSDTMMQIHVPTGTGFWDLWLYDVKTNMFSCYEVAEAFYLQDSTVATIRNEDGEMVMHLMDVFDCYAGSKKVSCGVAALSSYPPFVIEDVHCIDDSHVSISYLIWEENRHETIIVELEEPIISFEERNAILFSGW